MRIQDETDAQWRKIRQQREKLEDLGLDTTLYQDLYQCQNPACNYPFSQLRYPLCGRCYAKKKAGKFTDRQLKIIEENTRWFWREQKRLQRHGIVRLEDLADVKPKTETKYMRRKAEDGSEIRDEDEESAEGGRDETGEEALDRIVASGKTGRNPLIGNYSLAVSRWGATEDFALKRLAWQDELAKLPATQRKVARLLKLGLKHREIAQQIGISRVHVSRLAGKLRQNEEFWDAVRFDVTKQG